ncbi:hypothetical protein [Bradyrhizobium sp. USDA 10063]
MRNEAERQEQAPGLDKGCAGAAPIQIVLHNDDETPLGFVVGCCARYSATRSGMPLRLQNPSLSGARLSICARYPPSVAKALLEEAQDRIQAQEFPLLPDTTGRRKLIRLYGMRLPLDAEIVAEAVHRTEGLSAAFIKELMRRIAQSSIARNGGNSVITADIEEALNDMLFTGGRLNVKLLGGSRAMAAWARIKAKRGRSPTKG